MGMLQVLFLIDIVTDDDLWYALATTPVMEVLAPALECNEDEEFSEAIEFLIFMAEGSYVDRDRRKALTAARTRCRGVNAFLRSAQRLQAEA